MRSSSKDAVYSRRQIEGLIAQGRQIFILDGQVIKADAWIQFHPGGDLAIKHMIGRDATDEVTVLHTAQARQKMQSFRIGIIEGLWKNFTPPIQGGIFRLPERDIVEKDEKQEAEIKGQKETVTADKDIKTSTITLESPSKNTIKQKSDIAILDNRPPVVSKEAGTGEHYLQSLTDQQHDADLTKYPALDDTTQQLIIKKYRALYKEIIARGFFECNYWNYAIEVTRYSLLFFLFATTLRSGWYKVSGIILGLFWHQLVFSAHDAGHMGITHNYQFDTVIGIVIADFIGGLSMGWWKRSHNVHHIVTNSTEHDPDIQLLPFFAVSHKYFKSLFSTYHSNTILFDKASEFLVPYQHYLYYPVLCLGRFNLYIQSWVFLLTVDSPKKGPARWHRTIEMVGQVFFWYWFGYLVLWRSIPTWFDRVAFVLLSHMMTAPLHVQITMSHYAMSTADLGVDECFAQKMLRTTMDVDCPHWLDWIHGGLQFQAIHHLYPKIPRHNLRSVQHLVQKFCSEVDIPYALLGFVDGNKSVISHLAEVGRHATIFAKCHEAVIKSEDFGMH